MQVYPDITNLDQRYVRNKLRLAVFPLLQEINPAAVDHICGMAEIAQLECQLVDALAQVQLGATTVCCHLVSRGAQAGVQVQQQQQGQRHLQPQQQQEEEHHLQAVPVPPWLYGGHGGSAMLNNLQLIPRLPLAGLQQRGGNAEAVPQAHFVSAQHSWSVRLQQQRAWIQAEAQPSGVQLQALSVPALADLHPALQRRVVQLWLSRHTCKSVTNQQVQEVLQLLQPGHGTGSKTSTLWRSSSVVRYQQLLVVLDASTAQELMRGQLQVQRDATDAAVSTQPVAPAAAAAAAISAAG